MTSRARLERADRAGRCPDCGRRTRPGQTLFRSRTLHALVCARCHRAEDAAGSWEALRAELGVRATQPGLVFLDEAEARALAAQLAPTGITPARRGEAHRWTHRLVIAQALGDRQDAQVVARDAYGIILDAVKHHFDAQLTGWWLAVLLQRIDQHSSRRTAAERASATVHVARTLDSTTASAVSLLTGLDRAELDALGGVRED